MSAVRHRHATLQEESGPPLKRYQELSGLDPDRVAFARSDCSSYAYPNQTVFAKMINNSTAEYVFIRVMIFFLRSIGPISIACTALSVWNIFWNSQRPTLSPLNCWFLAETLFHGFFFWYRAFLQREAIHPPGQTPEERTAFFEKIARHINDPVKFLSGWFKGARVRDICRDDLKDFLNWVFWEGRAEEHDAEELESYVCNLERMVDREFKPGRSKFKGLRLTIDPIEIEFRSLFWYMLMMIVDTSTHIRLFWYNFHYHRTTATSLAIFPPRPLALLSSNHSPAKNISYWLRPHTSPTRLPIVFIHGIGVGLYPYVEFLHEIDSKLNSTPSSDGEVGILAIEIPQISSRLTSPILSRAAFLSQINHLLEATNFPPRFVLASHSYGSVLATHILSEPTLASRVASTLFIDPVTILLHMPDVAYNFTARPPHGAAEWQLWYFGSKDPGVAGTLGRHFHWKENLLWREEIEAFVDQGMRVTISLASRDLIVDTEGVGKYLMDGRMPDPMLMVDEETGWEKMELRFDSEHSSDGSVVNRSSKPGSRGSNSPALHSKQRPWYGTGLEVLWYEDLDHAQVFDTAASRARLVDVLDKYSYEA